MGYSPVCTNHIPCVPTPSYSSLVLLALSLASSLPFSSPSPLLLLSFSPSPRLPVSPSLLLSPRCGRAAWSSRRLPSHGSTTSRRARTGSGETTEATHRYIVNRFMWKLNRFIFIWFGPQCSNCSLPHTPLTLTLHTHCPTHNTTSPFHTPSHTHTLPGGHGQRDGEARI